MLLGDGGGSLIFSFDNGTTSANLGGSGSVSWSENTGLRSDPADAGISATVSGSTTLGVTCPGALVATIPFSTLGQSAGVSFNVNSPGAPYTGSLLHMAFKIIIPSDTDGGLYAALQGPTNGSYGYIVTYVQGTYALADGGVPRDDAGNALQYQSPPAGINYPPLLVPNSTPIGSSATQQAVLNLNFAVSPDGGPTPMTFYLNQIGARLVVPSITDAGAAPLTSPDGGPLTVQLVLDDIWVN
jgi:hypothetical protein